jgi:hypothetical protein
VSRASLNAVGLPGTDGVAAAVGLVLPSTRTNIWTGVSALRSAAAAIGIRLRTSEGWDAA